MAKVKALLDRGLASLCGYIRKCNTAVDTLASATADGLDEVDDILHEKQDVTAAVALTIPVNGWSKDTAYSGYYYCDIPLHGLLATDIVDVIVSPGSYGVARTAGFGPTESLAGTLRLRAAKVPAAAISAQYHIIRTVRYAEEG